MRKIAHYSIRVAIPLLFFFYAFNIVNIEEVVNVFLRADWKWFNIGCFCILSIHFLGALRTRLLFIEKEMSISKLWIIQSISSLIIGIMPFRIGEFSYVHLLRKHFSIPPSEGVPLIVSIRFVEYILSICILLVLSFLGSVIKKTYLMWFIFLIIGMNVAVIFLFTKNQIFFFNLVERINKTLVGKIFGKTTSEKVGYKFAVLSNNFKRVTHQNFSQNMLAITFISVLLRHFFILSMLKSMGAPITLSFLIFLFTLSYVTTFIQGIGSFGSEEVGFSSALILSDISKKSALSIAIGAHLLEWIPILFFGSLAYIILSFPKLIKLKNLNS